MQEVFEKIIERLENASFWTDSSFDEDGYCNDDSEEAVYLHEAIEIVKQEAEKYEECYKDCRDCEAYDKEKFHCPKFCEVIKETVKEIEENHNGWIPCSERLPENISTVILQVEEIEKPTFGFYGNMNGWRLTEKDFVELKDFTVIAWQPLPPEYQPKGE